MTDGKQQAARSDQGESDQRVVGVTGDDYDPHAVPISHAATVMLLDDRPDLHVLMVHRTAKVVFAPDMWVFPGGRVDPEDHLADFDTLCRGLSDREASAILEVERGGLAWWVAAARETLEEAGLLLATGERTNTAPEDWHRTVAEVRQRVLEDESVFADVLLERGISLDVTPIEEVARFVTPLGSPRRFDARFFVARAPADQDPSHDEGEIVNCEWIRPEDALAQWRNGSMEMMSPTVRMVACLARYRSADEVLAVARRRLPYKRVRVIDPDGAYEVVLPGEPGYEHAQLEIETGFVRLWEAGGAT
ncbi:MAG: hypothetical protein AAF531_10910 [Actinomycetota bacterium]